MLVDKLEFLSYVSMDYKFTIRSKFIAFRPSKLNILQNGETVRDSSVTAQSYLINTT